MKITRRQRVQRNWQRVATDAQRDYVDDVHDSSGSSSNDVTLPINRHSSVFRVKYSLPCSAF